MTIFRSGIVVASFTFISRIFGLARELFIADLFGVTSNADAVNVAFKLPNLFRRIFGEGALSTVFIPILNEKLIESNLATKKFSSNIFIPLLIILCFLVLIAQLLMPYLMFIIAPGFSEDDEKFKLTILLCRITMPYLILISVVAFFGSILNSVKRFAAFAFSPVILNISMILNTYLFSYCFSTTISISLSIILAGLFQVVFMFYCLAKANLTFPIICKPQKDKSVNQFLKNIGPAALSAGVGQFNIFISQSIASFVPGAVSILSYADRIYQFPLSIIGVSFATILLPELSKIYKSNNMSLANNIQNKAIGIALLLSLPATFGIIALSGYITHIIYERGAFTCIDTQKTSQVISAFTIGLPAFVLSKILISIFYANNDTRTPLKIALYSLTINTICNILLMPIFSYIGIALGTSFTAWFNVWLLYHYAHKAGRISIELSIINIVAKILLSCTLMYLVIILIINKWNDYFYSHTLLIKIFLLGVIILVGTTIIAGMSYCFKLHHSLSLK
ncbi:MAG: murein biosynthesis integral membrane protein MurJ [Rickettsiaceae bacterium]|nr:MAG: murein biosynthesis integral membrane protein MurJ [Rickettsiaceae bacterium]